MAQMQYPRRVHIVEVGPRDGLQNEPNVIPTDVKATFVTMLAQAGLQEIEATSFVSPKAIPQLADAKELMGRLPWDEFPDVTFSALVPNLKGLERAVECGVKRISVFTAASNTFVQRNINMTIAESLSTFEKVVTEAKSHGMSVRGYVSTAFLCPYEREIPASMVQDVTESLLEMGCDQVSIGDTIGAAAPKDVYETVGHLLESIEPDKLALHFHNTYGMAMANIMAGLDLGITTYDASAGGLGGCPYAPGASGNVATEDVLYLMNRLGIDTGVNLERTVRASYMMQQHLGRPLPCAQLRVMSSGPQPVEHLEI